MGKSKKVIPEPSNITDKKRIPFTNEPDSFYSLQPAWRFRRIDKEYLPINEENFHIVEEKLKNFESMTWHSILTATKSGEKSRGSMHHFVSMDKLIDAAQSRLSDMHLDEFGQLLSIRLSGKERIWGIMERGVLYLLWYDPKHIVCPSLNN
jgi:hypothetical protein